MDYEENVPQNMEELLADLDRPLDQVIESLPRKQAMAMHVIMSGGTIASAAKVAGVARSTIYEWMSSGHPFQAALDQWTRDLVQTARNRLVIMTDKATVAVQESLRRGEVRTGLRLLERLGVLASPPTGKTEAEVRRRAGEIKVTREARKLRREREVESFIGEWKVPGGMELDAACEGLETGEGPEKTEESKGGEA